MSFLATVVAEDKLTLPLFCWVDPYQFSVCIL